MATTSRQTSLFGVEDWKRIYKTYKEADFQSYNFETLRKTFIDYLRQHHPESFNDYTESSEFIAILDLIAFMGQSLSFRNDLNTRENFLDTAERRDSVTRLAKLVGYTPKRNEAANGFLKVAAISTTENIVDYNRNQLANSVIRWNDKTNEDWQEQFATVLNAVLVNSQRIGQPGRSATIVGVKTDEYQIRMAEGFLPVIPFSATVDGVRMDFEVVNATSTGKTYLYEPAPRTNGPLNILYRDDKLGFSSPDTGFFFHFKQGLLQRQDFTLSDRIANRSVDVNIPGTNNEDVWLYEIGSGSNTLWTEVESIYSSQSSQTEIDDRRFYSITSRTDDQITLNFGDGVFSTIPIGTFRCYARSSNGLEYIINTSEIQNVDIEVRYISKLGRAETATFTLALTNPVSNAKNRENLTDIKRRAPARFYTQNRMVNGEDYNNFPFTNYGSIIKSKAINRATIGTSRYLDLIDPTGKYSSINTFGADGMLYQDLSESSFTFTFNDRNDIQSVIVNQVEPLISKRGTIHFYYDQFSRVPLDTLSIFWNQSTTFTNETTGYFKNSVGTPLPIASFVNDNRKYIVSGALVKFVPPTGSHFNVNNRIEPGLPVKATDKLEIWASVLDIYLDGTNFGVGNFDDGSGPIKLNNFVPSGAVPMEIILPYKTDLPASLEQDMLVEIELYRNLGLGYDHINNEWYLITHDNIDLDGEFSIVNARATNNLNNDASWLIKFESTITGYVVTSRTLNYYFASVLETRFFFEGNRKIYDPKTGKIVNDFIKILKTNAAPDDNRSLSSDIVLDIIDQSVESDGYINDFNVEVSFTDNDSDGLADDPDFFKKFVNPDVNINDKKVFFQSTVDFDNLERWLPVAPGSINSEYPTGTIIGQVKTEYPAGTVFYAFEEDKFYSLDVNGIAREVNERSDYIARVGRGDIQFQYRHNAPDSRRINPGVSNIIDVYVVTSAYYEAYRRYIQDTTNRVQQPAAPTTDQLTVEFDGLQDYRMISDNMILNSVKFKPLFGDKAEPALQAFIKVVKLPNTVISNSEIKSQIISHMNDYFDINIWDFGDTFYFSELSAYLHSKMGDAIGSVVIIPKDRTQRFGNLYEIKSAPYEIFTNAATVNDVEIIDALTASKLQIGN
jgi:hypothetical protein